jgi:hypothetical protein
VRVGMCVWVGGEVTAHYLSPRSEADYNYTSGNGTDFTCWSNAQKRVALTIDNYTDVPRSNEAQLAAAVLLQVDAFARTHTHHAPTACTHP